MLFLEIWIRKGEYEYGCLKLNESLNDSIRYENKVYETSTLKYYYYCRASLEYETQKSRWTFALRWNRYNTYIEEMKIWTRKYFIEDCHFETSGKCFKKLFCEI